MMIIAFFFFFFRIKRWCRWINKIYYHSRIDFTDNSRKCPQIDYDPAKREWHAEAQSCQVVKTIIISPTKFNIDYISNQNQQSNATRENPKLLEVHKAI